MVVSPFCLGWHQDTRNRAIRSTASLIDQRKTQKGVRSVMNLLPAALLLIGLGAPAASTPQSASPLPGPEAARAYELFEAEDPETKAIGCAAFLDQIRSGNPDPWSYRGAAFCAAELEELRPTINETLATAPLPAFASFARGVMAYSEDDLDSAELLLRQTLQADERLALAWNALAAVVQRQGDIEASLLMLEQAVVLAPDLEVARNNLALIRVPAGVFERLRRLLLDLSLRWTTVPNPIVPPSGKRQSAILANATIEDLAEARALIARLSRNPLDERPLLIAQALRRGKPSEASVWLPRLLTQPEHRTGLREAAVMIEAWIAWAESIGRKDALLWAVGDAIEVITSAQGVSPLVSVVDRWSKMEAPSHLARPEAYLRVRIADVLSKLGNHNRALTEFRQARQLSAAVDDPLGQGDTWRGEADVLFLLGDLDGSLTALRRARTLFEAGDSLLGQGTTWHREANVLFRWGDLDGAMVAVRSAREFFERADSPLGVGITWTTEGEVLYLLGKLRGALTAFQQAKELAQAGGSKLGAGNAWLREADVLFRLGDMDSALGAYQRAREILEAHGGRLGQGNAWRGEADVLLRLVRIDGALTAYRRAQTLLEAHGDRVGQGNAWRGEANVLFLLGDFEAALTAYQRARRLFEVVDDRIGQGNCLDSEANVLLRMGNLDDALTGYRRAREIFEAHGDRLGQGNTWQGEADVLFRSGDLDRSLAAYRRASELYDTANDPQGRSATLLGEADVFLAEGALHRARRKAAEAATLAASIGNHWTEINALSIQIDASLELGDLEEVLITANAALVRFEAARLGFSADRHRTSADNSVNRIYNPMLIALAHLGRPRGLLVRSEQARSRVLLDLIASGHSARQNEVAGAQDFQMQRERIAGELAGVSRALDLEPPRAERIRLRQRQRALDVELERLGLEEIFATDSGLATAPPLSFAAIQKIVRDSSPTLLFYVTKGETFFFLLARDGSMHWRVLNRTRGEWRQRARSLAESLANPNYERRARGLARGLWDDLLGPMAEHLPQNGPLTIVPHGPLHQLPFESLVSPDGSYLFERFDLAIVPSLSVLSHIRGRHRSPNSHDGITAMAAGVGLAQPRLETRRISPFFDAQQTTLLEATRYHDYKRLAHRSRHLLIASQAAHVPGLQQSSYIQIAASQTHDHRLTSGEISNIMIDAELVTLAACDTAHAEALFSDERLDLTRAFLLAGAASVLATRWKIPENFHTSQFLIDFYRSYREGGPEGRGMRKDQALTQARKLSQNRGDPSQVWSAWVLIGDAR